jgi:hypothetical protein
MCDIIENSLEANASKISVDLIDNCKSIEVTINDNGNGISTSDLKEITSPLFTTVEKHRGRNFGFGLAFVKQATDLCNGTFSVTSQENIGTTVKFSFPKESIDRPPLGALTTTLFSVMLYDRDYELIFNRVTDFKNIYTVRRSELIDAVGGFEQISSIKSMKKYLTSLEENS